MAVQIGLVLCAMVCFTYSVLLIGLMILSPGFDMFYVAFFIPLTALWIHDSLAIYAIRRVIGVLDQLRSVWSENSVGI